MGVCRLRLIALPLVLVSLFAAPAATAGRDAGLAALQVALQSRGLYAGAIDGVKGPGTITAIRRFQRRVGLTPNGIPGRATRKALGRYGTHVLGSRPLTRGATGWDVAALQFLLAWHGFPSATIDGGLGVRTELALRRFQRWAGLEPDGVAGTSTYAALRLAPASCPISLACPVPGRSAIRSGRGEPLPRRLRHHRAERRAGRSCRRRAVYLAGRPPAAGQSWSWSRTRTGFGRCTRTFPRSPSESVSSSSQATGLERSERPATPPGRICTSRSGSAARRSTRARLCRKTHLVGSFPDGRESRWGRDLCAGRDAAGRRLARRRTRSGRSCLDRPQRPPARRVGHRREHATDQLRPDDALTPLRGAVNQATVRRLFKPETLGAVGKTKREATPRAWLKILRESWAWATSTARPPPT